MEPSHEFPHELRDVAARLSAERPELTPLELDAIQRRTLGRAHRARPAGRYGAFVRSRLAITFAVVLGFVFSTAGVGLAVSGASSSGNAASAQYAPEPHHKIGPSGISHTPPAQPMHQTEATSNSSSLPFTGLAAIPILVGGVALLGFGLVLRRSARHTP